MSPRTSFVPCIAIAGIMALLSAPAAQAQSLLWDWGGETKVDGAGRQLVRLATTQKPGNVIVSFGDRRLYLVLGAGEALSYPIAIPREASRWHGITTVTSKRENPSWTPTPSMRAENPKLPSWVPGGHPMNPLGIRALYLGSSTYRIHGTDAPWTIGSAVSKGCVRMYNKDVLDLYPRVQVGATVHVTWDKFEVTVEPVGKMAAAIGGNATPSTSRLQGNAVPARPAKMQTGTLRFPAQPEVATSATPKRRAPRNASPPETPEVAPGEQAPADKTVAPREEFSI